MGMAQVRMPYIWGVGNGAGQVLPVNLFYASLMPPFDHVLWNQMEDYVLQ